MWDVVIVGAGPAGSVAAHVLAREGRTVLLVDPLTEQSVKIGETLPGAALRMLRRLGLPTPDQSGRHTPIGGTLSCWDSDELMATDFFRDPDGSGWRLDRLCFDASLRETAIASGAVFKRTRMTEIQRNRGKWRITLANRDAIQGTWVIDATGRSASVARRLGAHRVRDNSLIAVYALGEPQKRISTNRTVIEATRSGWWYIGLLPSGAAIAGFHFLPQSTPFRLGNESWNCELEQTHHIKTILQDVVFAPPLIARDASGGRLSSPNGDAWLACGDAAVCFDPISGQGIFSAIYGGMSAGFAIHKSLRGDGTALGEYKLRLEEIRRIYQSSCKSMYERQNRWPDSEFWVRMRQH